jgi:iron(III) transport system ATP-binding protein
VIYVTHDQVEAMAIGDRVGLLRKGKLVQVGSPIDLYRNPCDPEVADFFGQMNWLDGVVGKSRNIVETSLGSLAVAPCNQVSSGQRVSLGIRPECVVPINGQVVVQPNVLEVQLLSTAFLGEQVVSHFAAGNQRLISKTRTTPAGHGSRLRVAIEPADIMVFPSGGR